MKEVFLIGSFKSLAEGRNQIRHQDLPFEEEKPEPEYRSPSAFLSQKRQ